MSEAVSNDQLDNMLPVAKGLSRTMFIIKHYMDRSLTYDRRLFTKGNEVKYETTIRLKPPIPLEQH